MTELITLFIPVVLLCETPNVTECQLMQHKGYFMTQKACQEFTQDNLYKAIPKKGAYADSWCVEVKVQRKTERFVKLTKEMK